eukprot:Nk52_evm2s770 gene=Nk52_evmTU2s770
MRRSLFPFPFSLLLFIASCFFTVCVYNVAGHKVNPPIAGLCTKTEDVTCRPIPYPASMRYQRGNDYYLTVYIKKTNRWGATYHYLEDAHVSFTSNENGDGLVSEPFDLKIAAKTAQEQWNVQMVLMIDNERKTLTVELTGKRRGKTDGTTKTTPAITSRVNAAERRREWQQTDSTRFYGKKFITYPYLDLEQLYLTQITAETGRLSFVNPTENSDHQLLQGELQLGDHNEKMYGWDYDKIVEKLKTDSLKFVDGSSNKFAECQKDVFVGIAARTLGNVPTPYWQELQYSLKRALKKFTNKKTLEEMFKSDLDKLYEPLEPNDFAKHYTKLSEVYKSNHFTGVVVYGPPVPTTDVEKFYPRYSISPDSGNAPLSSVEFRFVPFMKGHSWGESQHKTVHMDVASDLPYVVLPVGAFITSSALVCTNKCDSNQELVTEAHVRLNGLLFQRKGENMYTSCYMKYTMTDSTVYTVEFVPIAPQHLPISKSVDFTARKLSTCSPTLYTNWNFVRSRERSVKGDGSYLQYLICAYQRMGFQQRGNSFQYRIFAYDTATKNFLPGIPNVGIGYQKGVVQIGEKFLVVFHLDVEDRVNRVNTDTNTDNARTYVSTEVVSTGLTDSYDGMHGRQDVKCALSWFSGRRFSYFLYFIHLLHSWVEYEPHVGFDVGPQVSSLNEFLIATHDSNFKGSFTDSSLTDERFLPKDHRGDYVITKPQVLQRDVNLCVNAGGQRVSAWGKFLSAIKIRVGDNDNLMEVKEPEEANVGKKYTIHKILFDGEFVKNAKGILHNRRALEVTHGWKSKTPIERTKVLNELDQYIAFLRKEIA